MRTGLFLLLLSIAMTVDAGTLEKCLAKEKGPDGVQSCVDAEHNRSANRLREMNPVVLESIHKEIRPARHKALLREYRTAQAHHVRQRKAVCHKQEAGNARNACEADMNYAHIDQLARFLPNKVSGTE
jgi:hypothetical protein